MNNTLLHTPEGMRDRYNEECARKENIKGRLMKVIHSYGYRDIETPTIEFFDIFNKDKGSVISRDMFKLFDKENNTLVIRPDITPAIARAVSKYFADEDMPIRLSYCGNTFVNSQGHQGKMKEATQVGAELIGDETSDADAEMIALIIDTLKSTGLLEFQVDIGHVGFFEGIVEEAGLDEEETLELKELLEAKNYFGIDELLSANNVSEESKNVILKITESYGTIEQISGIRDITKNEKIISSVDYLEKLYQILKFYGLEQYVTFDLGTLSHYKYYTGIIFQAYTYGTGEMIVTGGRYDKLISQFGKNSASVGFGINLDMLMLALSRQNIAVESDITATIVLYEREQKQFAIETAVKLRAEGCKIQLMKKFYEKSIDDYVELGRRSFIDRIVYIDADGNTSEIKID
ncbi:MAG: ATP phosphoribosyltransferase regulatory subunit [Lachnospiraceae bacterium]|nr:ATP phosphoribosyltransferase regulatory subunit [Lachnospiraceae bacterium]